MCFSYLTVSNAMSVMTTNRECAIKHFVGLDGFLVNLFVAVFDRLQAGMGMKMRVE